MNDYVFTLANLEEAHELFVDLEPRCTAYHRARKAIRGADWDIETLNVAVWRFLKKWNWTYYRYKPVLLAKHPIALRELLDAHLPELQRFYGMTIEELPKSERESVVKLFQTWEKRLGPVGAAKALHVLVPRVFPLWDRKIARGYKIALYSAGTNGGQYWRFLRKACKQCLRSREEGYTKRNLLKRIDEWNYITFTKGLVCS